MLGKLLKYEWKSTGKIILLLNVYIIFLTIMGKIMTAAKVFESEDSNVQFVLTIFLTAYVLSILAVAIAVLLFLISRFYKNMYTDEGYLLHTLPVQTWKLILAKFIYAYAVLFVTMTIITGSILAVIMTKSDWHIFLNNLAELPSLIEENMQVSFPVIATLFTIYVLLSFAQNILSFYAAISLGQQFKTHRIIGSLLFYALFYITEQMITTGFLLSSGLIRFLENDISEVSQFYVFSYFSFVIIETAMVTAIFWFLTQHTAHKRLNLE